jgi:hypothetical protein
MQNEREVILSVCKKWLTDQVAAEISQLSPDAVRAIACAILTLQDDLQRARRACNSMQSSLSKCKRPTSFTAKRTFK